MTTPESAVQRCLDAFNQADAREDARNDFSPEALARVNLAWRHAMPILTPDTLDAFLACVTQGLIYQVFPLAEASKLLYAAQVTLGLLRARREAARQQSKPEPKSELAAPQVPPTPSPVEGGEAAVSRTAGAPLNQGDAAEPQPSCAPSMATASSSPWVGNHEPKPTEPGTAAPTPLPPSQMAAKPQSAAPQVPRKDIQAARNQVDEFLAQLYAGKLPAESSLTPCAAVLDAAPPTPLPLTMAAAQPQLAAPQVPAS